MLCKYINNSTVDICTSAQELEYLGLKFEPQSKNMSKEDVEELIGFLVEDAAARAGYYPPEYNGGEEDADDMSNVEIQAAVKNENEGLVCFRVSGLVHSESLPPDDFSIETYPGADEGLQDLTFDDEAPERPERAAGERAIKKLSKDEINTLKKVLESPDAKAALERLNSLIEVFERGTPINGLYFVKVKNLESIKEITDRIPDEVIKASAVYKLNGVYYLKLVLREPMRACTKRIMLMDEYGETIIPKTRASMRYQEIEEHGKLIIKDNVKCILTNTLG